MTASNLRLYSIMAFYMRLIALLYRHKYAIKIFIMRLTEAKYEYYTYKFLYLQSAVP